MPRKSAELTLWEPKIRMETRADGSMIVWQEDPLGPYPRSMNARFLEWAARQPDKPWLAERAKDGSWHKVTWGQAANLIQSVGSALLDLGLSTERPLLILSGNSVAHAIMALGAQHVGIPSAAISPAYALASEDRGKLENIRDQLTPGMVFVEDTAPFAAAIDAVFSPDIPVVSCSGTMEGRTCLGFDALCQTPHSDQMTAAFAAVGPDTVAKFLFTSGTTGSPKAVIQTQKMLCSNQEIVQSCYAFMKTTPPVVVDWAPWNHTAAGNKVFNLVIYNGGTYYIDDGRPTPKDMAKTIRNLREVSPTWYFNVPVGYALLVDAMEKDTALRQNFFRDLQMLMYAGAGMAQPLWDKLTRLSEMEVEGGVRITTGLGATETGPFALAQVDWQKTSGNLGIPSHGVVLKLVPIEGKLEARLKSPSITPGYWRNEKLSQEAFDEEGFYRLGDALRFAVPGEPDKGFIFDGRTAENFKLATGTWVAVGPLRAQLMNDLHGLAGDCVIAGENQNDLRALLTPNWPEIRALVGADADEATALASPVLREKVADHLAGHVARSTGSASRVVAVMFLETPLSFAKGEVTDKGSVNQRAVLRERGDLVAALWSDDPRVITPKGASA